MAFFAIGLLNVMLIMDIVTVYYLQNVFIKFHFYV
jgi:hypothetical protein